MTILVSDLGDTVVAKFKKGSDELADFTVLPKEGIWRSFLDRHPWLLHYLQRSTEERAKKKRLRKGFDVADPRADSSVDTSGPSDGDVETSDEPEAAHEAAADVELTQRPTIAALAAEAEADQTKLPTRASLSRRIAFSIKKVSADLKIKNKCYTYEEWVEFTRLIRLTDPERLDRDLGTSTTEGENEEGLVDWDWIGEDSPMMSGVSESEWLMERLIESLVRLEKRKEIARDKEDAKACRKMEG
jgi:potassium channel subfamily K